MGVGQFVPGPGQGRNTAPAVDEHEQGQKGDRHGPHAKAQPHEVILGACAPLALGQEALLVRPHPGDQGAGLVHENLAA